MKIKKWLILFFLFEGIMASFHSLFAQNQNVGKSVYSLRIDDPKAVYFTKDNFAIAADGLGDDASALQAAIDLVEKQSSNGIVFIPEGTYRLGRTVYLWRGIRLIGYGTTRPTFKLGDNTLGYQEGDNKYMIHFCQSRGSYNGPVQPGAWRNSEFIDGTFDTFYSGINNINFEICNGNPAAIAVRFHIAQLCALENIDFNIGNGRGAVEEMGNIIENCSFRGGEFGIKTGASAPGWQCTVLDCTFEGQRESSVKTKDAKMLVIRGRFKNAPIGISVPGTEQLFVKDTWFEDIENSAIVIKSYTSPALQVNLDNIKFSNVLYSVRFEGRIQGRSKDEAQMDFKSPAPIFTIKKFSHGLHLENIEGNAVTRFFGTKEEQFSLETVGDFAPKDIPSLPPQKTWINILDMGAKGDGVTDCTAIFKKAIAKYDAIYIPMGKYCISETLILRDQTTLIGFHPFLTQIVLKNGTSGFMDTDDCKPLLIAPENGVNGITGIGFDLGINPGAIGIKWMAGIHSYINDALFRGERSETRGEGQTYSIWITAGGGGVFKNIWAPDVRAKCAFFISNTKTPGKIFEVSIEHHKDVEVRLENVANWRFYALQIEEDRGSEKALGIYVKDCRNILFANLRSHRTTGVWEPYHSAILLRNSKDITIQGNMMGGTVFPFDNCVFDEITGMIIPTLTFAKLVIK